jgi:hypothetical protein
MPEYTIHFDDGTAATFEASNQFEAVIMANKHCLGKKTIEIIKETVED